MPEPMIPRGYYESPLPDPDDPSTSGLPPMARGHVPALPPALKPPPPPSQPSAARPIPPTVDLESGAGEFLSYTFVLTPEELDAVQSIIRKHIADELRSQAALLDGGSQPANG